MSRHLDNLKRLFGKLQVRYGDHDEMVLQVKQELDFREGVESGYQHSTLPNHDGLPGHASRSSLDLGSMQTLRSTGLQ